MTDSQTNPLDSLRVDNDRQTADEAAKVIRRDLHELIRETFLQLRPTLQFGDTDDLVEIGVLDSLAFVELIAEIQNRYDIIIRDVDITAENFASVATMARYVGGRSAI